MLNSRSRIMTYFSYFVLYHTKLSRRLVYEIRFKYLSFLIENGYSIYFIVLIYHCKSN